MGTTLGAALSGVFGGATSGVGGGNSQIPASVKALIASAESYYKQALAALKNEDLTTYSADMNIVGSLVAEANRELAKAAKTAPSTGLHASTMKVANIGGSAA